MNEQILGQGEARASNTRTRVTPPLGAQLRDTPPTQPVAQAMMELEKSVESLSARLEEFGHRLEAILRPGGPTSERPVQGDGRDGDGEGVALAVAINVQADRIHVIRASVIDLLERVAI